MQSLLAVVFYISVMVKPAEVKTLVIWADNNTDTPVTFINQKEPDKWLLSCDTLDISETMVRQRGLNLYLEKDDYQGFFPVSQSIKDMDKIKIHKWKKVKKVDLYAKKMKIEKSADSLVFRIYNKKVLKDEYIVFFEEGRVPNRKSMWQIRHEFIVDSINQVRIADSIQTEIEKQKVEKQNIKDEEKAKKQRIKEKKEKYKEAQKLERNAQKLRYIEEKAYYNEQKKAEKKAKKLNRKSSKEQEKATKNDNESMQGN